MRSFRYLVLSLCLCLAQIGASAHGVNHALDEMQGVMAHHCDLCLAAHDLGAAAPTVATFALAPTTPNAPSDPVFAAPRHLAPPLARQGAPPVA